MDFRVPTKNGPGRRVRIRLLTGYGHQTVMEFAGRRRGRECGPCLDDRLGGGRFGTVPPRAL
jgi:hypothetical protein